MTPEQLKASILQYAMEGRLVKQYSNDEPASILLEKIKAEKEKLVKEGKIKKSKKLPVIEEDEKPFDIPDSWEWVRFGNIVNFNLGKTPSKTTDIYWHNGTVPWVTIKDMQDKTLSETDKQVSDRAIREVFNNNVCQPNTLLMSFKLTIGKTSILNIKAVHNEAIIDIIPLIDDNHIFRNYLFFILPYISQYASSNYAIKGKTLNKTSINNMLIPLPPLAEQKRIVAKIEKLMPLVDKYAEAYNRLKKIDDEFDDRLKQSILQYSMEGKLVKQNPDDEPASVLLEKIKTEKEKLIQEGKIKKTKKLPEITDEEKPFGIPDSWEWTRLGDISNFVGTGMVVPKSKQSNIKTEKYKFPYFKMNNIGNWNGNFLLNDLMYIENSPIISRYFLKSNEILFNTRNSKELVGKTTVVPNKLTDKIIANNNILRIDLIQNDSAKFINEYLISPVMRNIFWNITTATTNVAAIYQKQLILILVPLPPLAEQKRIVAKIKKLDYLINQL